MDATRKGHVAHNVKELVKSGAFILLTKWGESEHLKVFESAWRVWLTSIKVRPTYHSFHKITNERGFFRVCLCNKCSIVHFLSTKNLIWSCYDLAQFYYFLVSYCSLGSAPYIVRFFTMHNHLIRTKFWSEFHVESTIPSKTLLKKKNYNCNLRVRKWVKASYHYFMLLGEWAFCNYIFSLYRPLLTQANNERSAPLHLSPIQQNNFSSLRQLTQQLPARTKLTQLLQSAHGKYV